MIDKIINQVYINVIDIILSDIDNNDKEEVKRNFIDYLYSLYSDKEINENNYEKMLAIITDLENNKWESRDKNSKLYYFKEDKSFDAISNLSKKAYTLALSKRQNDELIIDREEIEKDINELIRLVDTVEEFNKEEAKRLVSEGILDFSYAIGETKDITSFRISHLK